MERDPAAVASATARVEQAGVSNVRFAEGDVQTLAVVESGFDAVVGRLVLMYVDDPVGVLARATELLRPGGLVCVQECDLAYDWAQPMTPLWTQIRGWLLETVERGGFATRLGLSLYANFVAAGLPPPQLRLECALAGGPEAPAWGWANVMRGVLPLMERLGVATAAELEPDTLAQSLLDDVIACNGIVLFGPLIGAWARTQPRP